MYSKSSVMAAQRIILFIPISVFLTQLCILAVHAANGNWGGWMEWEHCSASCGEGERRRMRFCNSPPPSRGGARCAGRNIQYEECEAPFGCPVDGVWSKWSEWTACSVTCGEGVHSRQRQCDSPPPAHGGRICSGSSEESRTCVSAKDCPRDGKWSDWGEWSACSVTCGEGSSYQYRTCNNPPPSQNGKDCPGKNQQSRVCKMRKCSVNGHWSEWSEWSGCSVTCGLGVRQRWRKCDSPSPANGGDDCSLAEAGELQDSSCNGSVVFCAVHGGWTEWGEWGECIAPDCATQDGIAYTIRQRSCDRPYPAHHGSMCQGAFLNAGICGIPVNCPVDGGWSDWSDWRCSREFVTRRRVCDQPPPLKGGKDCPGPKAETYTEEDKEFEDICAHLIGVPDDGVKGNEAPDGGVNGGDIVKEEEYEYEYEDDE